MIVRLVSDFESWRREARDLIARSVPPPQIRWRHLGDLQRQLPLESELELPKRTNGAAGLSVPRAFVELARQVACHRDPGRWHKLYAALWRITQGERSLLEIEVDEQVRELRRMAEAVRRDIHKMHAFVRFEKQNIDGRDEYLAHYRPDHHVFRLAVPFFVERFSPMRWIIFGPDETAAWDGHQLTFLPGVPIHGNASGDELTQLWQSYYAATFNPARLNVRMMRREMPARFWPLLPETATVDRLVAEAPARTHQLIKESGNGSGPPLSARAFLPPERDLASLAHAARACQGCPLHEGATQTVFGQGPQNARVVFVGEQPGDQEDVAGQPFVGPAGQVFDELLAEAGIDRRQTYVTNTVKHFKWVPRGKRRLHAKPSSREIFACRPWLESELEAIHPVVLVLLGVTAAQAILGPQFRIQSERGQPRRSSWCEWTMGTYHPSAVLRARDPAHVLHIRQALLTDLKLVAARLREL